MNKNPLHVETHVPSAQILNLVGFRTKLIWQWDFGQ